jgi:hypothetical protein
MQPDALTDFTRLALPGFVNFGLAFGKYDVTCTLHQNCQSQPSKGPRSRLVLTVYLKQTRWL